ncbi:hypothetical protein ACQEVF_57115 [Nonomuraea polychroma]|uniref:hypothetical protein n=1 Tax=Nonomuraea polychroma TaxID=46176 RepID=UPI003D8FFFBE
MAELCQPWPTDSTWCADLPNTPADRTPLQNAAVEHATRTLSLLTGGRYGLCEHTVRPYCTACQHQRTPSRHLYLQAGLPGQSWRPCTHAHDDITLPGPIHQIVAVHIDGRILSPTAYRVDDGVILVRQDGGVWPIGQNLAIPNGQPGTFAVRYIRGTSVPLGGVKAVTVLACELVAQLEGRRCRLPTRVTSVDREGVSYQMADPTEWLAAGYTGVDEVDVWLAEVNPAGRGRTIPTVWSPDVVQHRRTEWT